MPLLSIGVLKGFFRTAEEAAIAAAAPIEPALWTFPPAPTPVPAAAAAAELLILTGS
jgi:hypothetical protein